MTTAKSCLRTWLRKKSRNRRSADALSRRSLESEHVEKALHAAPTESVHRKSVGLLPSCQDWSLSNISGFLPPVTEKSVLTVAAPIPVVLVLDIFALVGTSLDSSWAQEFCSKTQSLVGSLAPMFPPDGTESQLWHAVDPHLPG